MIFANAFGLVFLSICSEERLDLSIKGWESAKTTEEEL